MAEYKVVLTKEQDDALTDMLNAPKNFPVVEPMTNEEWIQERIVHRIDSYRNERITKTISKMTLAEKEAVVASSGITVDKVA